MHNLLLAQVITDESVNISIQDIPCIILRLIQTLIVASVVVGGLTCAVLAGIDRGLLLTHKNVQQAVQLFV